MRNRPAKVLFLFFQFFWLNVVVPGHTRGAVPLLGSSCSGERACCKPAGKEQGKPDKSRGCAICSFAAQLSVVPAVVCEAPPLLPLARVEAVRGTSLVSRGVLLPFDSRGPPLFA